jgi:hypothetical protein
MPLLPLRGVNVSGMYVYVTMVIHLNLVGMKRFYEPYWKLFILLCIVHVREGPRWPCGQSVRSWKLSNVGQP